MSIEEELEQAVRDWEDATRGIDASFAEYIMPLVKRAQAEAWAEGAESGFYNPEIRGFVDYPDNPYAEKGLD